LEHVTGTASFFQAMAPVLIANVLTIAFVSSFAKIHQKEVAGEEEGRLTPAQHLPGDIMHVMPHWREDKACW
jgi:hypothetical protein